MILLANFCYNVQIANNGEKMNILRRLYLSVVALSCFGQVDFSHGTMLVEFADEDRREATVLPIETPLHAAARNNDVIAAERLIQVGVDINALVISKETALHTAVSSNSEEVVRLLLRNGANPNARELLGRTPLHFAKTPVIAKLLMDNGADADILSIQGIAPLHYAIWDNAWDVVEVLLNNGADVNVPAWGKTPLYYAVENNYQELRKLLIGHGAELSVSAQKTPSKCPKAGDKSHCCLLI